MEKRSLWARLTLEGLVIVLSILLAFGIDAWWSERQERERVVNALFNLQAGFDEHVSLIDAELQRIEPFEERVAFFLNSNPDVTAPPASYGHILEALHRPMVDPLNGDELMALLDAEALRDVDAANLWAASAEWRGRWRVILDRHDSLYELEDEALRELARLEASRAVVSHDEPWEEVDESALQEARRDRVLLALAAAKSYHLRVLRLLYDRVRENADSVLVQISTELVELNRCAVGGAGVRGRSELVG